MAGNRLRYAHARRSPLLRAGLNKDLLQGQLPQEFKNPAANLGLLLGDASGDLLDSDIDSDEALALADMFLPSTGAEFGRQSKPRSHRLFRCPGAGKGTEQFRDPAKSKNDPKAMLVELRGSGGQTMAPPSIHPTGEAVEWNTDGIKPAEISYLELHRRTARLAAGALLVRYYPAKGSRNHAAMGLAGALLTGGFSEEEAKEFMGDIARIAGDDEVDNRIGTVASTKRRLDAGQPATGNPTCAECFGDRIWRTARSWLGLSAERATGKMDRPTIINVPGDLPETADAAVNALSDPLKFRIFKQEDRLIEVAELDTDTFDGPIRSPAGSIVHRSLSVPRMIDILTQAANWQSFDEKGTLRRRNAP
jgi:Bifunctional DNA primase/polymerase, N-terminal